MRGLDWNAWLWRLAVAVVIAMGCAAFWLSARDDQGSAAASNPSDPREAAHALASAAEPPRARPMQKAPFVPPAPSAQLAQNAPPTPSAQPTGATPSDAPPALATNTPSSPDTPAATPDTPPETPTTLAPIPPGTRWLGRVDTRDSQNPRFSWQGAGVIATVHGSAIAVKLRTEGTDSVFFQPVVDGKPTPRVEVESGTDRDVTLATGLADSDHEVALYRETEGQFGVSTFLGFTRGTVRAAPRSNGRLIEVIGDSISAGQGILGSETHANGVASSPCDAGPSNSSWFATYASLAGHALHAEVSTIARSGWGMYRDGTGDTQGVLSRLYDNTLGSSDTPKWTFDRQPAVVVINLGTNDWNVGDPGPAFESAARDFIQRIRSHYPSAWIFLAIGSKLWGSQFDQANARLQTVAAARAAAGDSKVISFDFGIQNLGADSMIPTGCAWHPSAAEHRRMASILRKQLTAKLGW